MNAQENATQSGASLSGQVKCFFGAHDWRIVAVRNDGISHLKECTRCGRGSFLHFLGHASTVGKVSRAEMQQWRATRTEQKHEN